jgi:UDP:flavonoid glycosyltransferase YjiC (YdhE family)
MAGAQQTMAIFTDPGIGEDVAHLVARQPPAAILIDHLLWAALKIAPRCGRPYATLVHTLYGQQRDSWTRGPGAQVARGFGFEPAELWHASQLVLVATPPELDPASADHLAAHVMYTGAVWQGAPRPAAPETPPLVLISLSTLAEQGQGEVIQRLLDAVAPLPVRAIATVGSLERASFRPPPNVELLASAPHETLLPRASLMISHGGHATAMATLSRDVPMLILPMFPLGDQPEMARLLAQHGAAVHLDKDSDVTRLRAAIEMVLADPSYRAAAGKLGRAIRRADGAETAARALLGLLGQATQRA